MYISDVPPSTNQTELWNGTNWTEVNNLNTAREDMGSGATNSDNTTAIAFGGDAPPQTGVTELWNGASWAEVADLNTSRTLLVGAGDNTNALAVGGENPTGRLGTTEAWSSTSTTTKTVTAG